MDQQSEPRHLTARRNGEEHEAGADRSPEEADPRFPSGRWQGYSLIPPERSPQTMELRLTFSDGTITGTGGDICGEFTVVGTYRHDGGCGFDKRYPDGQAVRYDGYHVNQGPYFGVSGVWVLDEQWHERFWIEPVPKPT